MKLKNIKYSLLVFVVLFSVTSCSEDYLNVDPKGTKLEENYYSNEKEATAGLVAVYDKLSTNSGGFWNATTFFNSGSDDCYGGGAPGGGSELNAFSEYYISPVTVPSSLWSSRYEGIFRANVLLEKLPEVPMDGAKKIRFSAEAKALRAYYYFELVRTFKNVPLITARVPVSEIYNVLQASPEAVYSQIEKDLIESIADLPAVITNKADEAARFTKGSAQALLGKVYLYEKKNALAAVQLAEVNGTPGGTSQYGYKLLSNFSDLWLHNNSFNTESIIATSHTNKSNSSWGNWGSGSDEGNTVNIMIGPRDYNRSDASAPDFYSGWSFNPVTHDAYDALKSDPRFQATIADVKALKAQGKVTYTPGFQDTGYFLRKLMPLKSDVSTGAGAEALNFKQNTYIIRLADTYLMEAEALGGTGARAQALLDAVRARVGLASVPVSINAIMVERRLEFVGEGHRWFDLVRTGKAAAVLANRGFIAGKNEILPIPLREMNNTKIIQNPNYN